MFRSYRPPVRTGSVISEADASGRRPSRLAAELLDLSIDGALTLWRWFPETGKIETFGNHTADSLEEWLHNTHADDAEQVLTFLEDSVASESATAVCEYRWRDQARGDWMLLRHSLRPSSRRHSRGKVVEGVLETVSFGARSRSLLDVTEEDLREGETRMVRFLEDAYQMFHHSDPLPLLQSLRAALRADSVAFTPFETRSHSSGAIASTAEEHSLDLAGLRGALSDLLTPVGQSVSEKPFEFELDTSKGTICHFLVRAIMLPNGKVSGALCAGFANAESRALAVRFDSLLTLTAILLSSRSGSDAWSRLCRDLLHEVKESRCRGNALARVTEATVAIETHFGLVDRSLSRLNAVSFDGSHDEFCEALGEARDNLGAATDILENLQASTKRSTVLHSSDLNRMVERTVSMLDGILVDSVSLFLDLDTRIEPIVCDESALREALLILMLEAQEHSVDKGIVSISTRLTASKEETGKGSAGFWISYLARESGDGGVVESGEDPVQALLTDSGVRVTRHRDVRDGISISLIFPADPPALDRNANAGSLSRNRLNSDKLRGAKVLLVEDQMAVRKLVRKLLEVLGCVVVEVASGREALDVWPEVRDEISLVVSDVVMPGGVSGWDLAKDLHHRHPDLAILLTSGHTAELERYGLNDVSEVAFLQKPYGFETLRDSLVELLEASRG